MDRPSYLQTPSSSRIPLGKRTASQAGLEPGVTVSSIPEPPSTMKRTNLLLQHDLERRLRSAQARELELQSQLDQARRENDGLKSVNRRLVEDDENKEREDEQRRLKEASDKQQDQSTIHSLRSSLQSLQSIHASLSTQLSSLQRSSTSSTSSLQNEITLLRSRLDASEEDLREYRDRATESKAECRTLRSRVGELVEELERVRREEGEEKVGAVLRDELHRQAKNLQNQDITLMAQKAELQQLRQRRDDVEALRQEAKTVERAWAEKCRRSDEMVEKLRSDISSLASNPSSSNEASSQLQEQLQTALHLHQDSLSTLSLKESELASLRSRLETLSQGSKGAVGTLAQKLDEAERELRIAKEGRKNAEVKVELLKEEVAVGRGKGSVGGGGFRGVGGVGNSMGQEERLRQLEGLLEMYKGKLKEIGRESGMAEAKVAEGMGYVKKALLEEAEGKVGSLQQEIASLLPLKDQCTSHEAEMTFLQSQIELLERRVAIGEYDPSTFRCLQLAINPSTQDLAIRTATLDALKAENEALLETLANGGGEGDGNMVPRESWEREVRERREEKLQLEKRLLRLKEVFKAKSQEFLDTLYSLLGYRINFSDNGDVRMNSTYAPKGKSGVTFRFASQEGHFGTMQLTGGMARSFDELREFWVTQRNDIPCFLASVTLELYDRTTRGKAAGWVRVDDEDENLV